MDIKRQVLTCNARKHTGDEEKEEINVFRNFLISRNGMRVLALDRNNQMSIKEVIKGIKNILERDDLTVYEQHVLEKALSFIQAVYDLVKI